jgi:serine protease Do
MRRWLGIGPLVAALATSARADEVDAWVKAKVAAQRAAKPAPTNSALWKEPPSSAAPLSGFQPPTSLAPLVKAVRPGVVNISTRNEGTSRSLGSGFIINPEGLVVTNNHVVERAQEILVRLSDGRSLSAQVVGRDPSTDLAVLGLPEAKGLPIVVLGDSDQLEIGDWVVAIGNPFGLDTSVTHGLISARERVLGLGPFDDFIQTNALINPGNSGGPLFDMRGNVVGVTTAMVSQGQGIGFAVPINLVKDLLPNLLDHGRPERGWLGLSVQELEGEGGRVVVVEVFPGSPALRAGIKVGDRVSKVGGRPVQRYQQLLRRVALLSPGTEINIELERGGARLDVSAVLVDRPGPQAAVLSTGRIDALGVVLRPHAGPRPGLKVEVIVPSSPAELAGLAAGDVVVEVNREPVVSLADLEVAMAQGPPAEPVLLRVQRGDSFKYFVVQRHR